jgi:hypothetical protein
MGNKFGRRCWEEGGALTIFFRQKGGRDYAELCYFDETDRPGS